MLNLQQASQFNVQATLGAWLAAELATYNRPSWLPSLPPVLQNWEAIELSVPCFALAHLPGGMRDEWQGRFGGGSSFAMRALGIMEVSCFASRNSSSYTAQLRTMADMVKHAAASTTRVVIKDYQANLSAPAATSFVVSLRDIDEVATEIDPNPGVARVRVLIAYEWTYRAV